ncbi:MAG TPA: DNA-formamidopyrimidine glycosylase family protein [Nocardioidaceae bacterium]|nr:DNA-formamidopyrimidine glycosylase family protein [Nocardioidaceae bacterium]
MPEGHTLFRLARDLRDRFAGRVVSVTSPQGRFVEAAALLDGTEVVDAESWGKHLFLEFAQQRHVHVHLGLYGRFDLHDGAPPPPVGQVRLRLATLDEPANAPVSDPVGDPGLTAGRASYGDLRGATACELVTPEQVGSVLARLGPDPLRADADWTRAWASVSRSRAPIGALLMDQAVLAGVGNVYRAEVLFRHRLHPLRPGSALRRAQFESLWQDLVVLMAEGARLGRIDTVHAAPMPAQLALRAGAGEVDTAGGRVYVYRRQGEPCYVCGSRIRTEVLAGRNLFWCPRCQPKPRARATTQGR